MTSVGEPPKAGHRNVRTETVGFLTKAPHDQKEHRAMTQSQGKSTARSVVETMLNVHQDVVRECFALMIRELIEAEISQLIDAELGETFSGPIDTPKRAPVPTVDRSALRSNSLPEAASR